MIETGRVAVRLDFRRADCGRKIVAKNANGPLRSKKGGGVSYFSARDFSAVIFEEIGNGYCAMPVMPCSQVTDLLGLLSVKSLVTINLTRPSRQSDKRKIHGRNAFSFNT